MMMMMLMMMMTTMLITQTYLIWIQKYVTSVFWRCSCNLLYVFAVLVWKLLEEIKHEIFTSLLLIITFCLMCNGKCLHCVL